ncbi:MULTISPECIES: vitamin K epoxide reductase family protein [Rhodococcus]|uniref:vitamin K epoxide reductase family protein n=1 Tax=Rhodococcus TaxID=1827 RepID=UPI002286A4DF|nr:vitamin K epoxide reductase family protein [Rhodococcus sp. JS3073]WAM14150.1 vitamin K epoxide reductase family protein [Rhodococcus sp. JS3073]
MPSTPRSPDAVETSGPAAPGVRSLERVLPWLLLVGGLIGLFASFVLTVEKFALAADSSYVPTCSINPVLNCGSVMATEQAAVFGFPNSLLGIAGFAVVAAAGAALLAGARVARWFWLALQAGLAAAVVFVHWLIAQSLYVIGALCPYCMVVWAVTVPLFWYVTVRNLRTARPTSPVQRAAAAATVDHLVPVTVWVLALLGLIVYRFWPYWSGLL